MTFQFSLESLLRLRRSQQRQQEILVQRESDLIGQLSRDLNTIAGQITRISADQKAITEVRASELRFDESRMEILGAQALHVEQLLQKALERRALLAAELHGIWQQREVLETLRRDERQEFAIEEGRREQRRQDDLFLLQLRKR